MVQPTHILDNLWLGDQNDANSFDGVTICVHEDKSIAAESTIHLPFLQYGTGGPRADRGQLMHIARIADSLADAGIPTLVHCAAGIERAPLAVAWLLWQHHRNEHPTMPAAMKHVQRLRPTAQNRLGLLEPRRRKRIHAVEVRSS